ncbi:hypothetical protein BCV69DRAFT_284659 [Microstroma glucosiphilum]|uniref:Autophagy-related protein 3 n=1 Tax=Pseudomicrostroma glucosiphilum TaxID=1684307 RepID=A0A316U0Y2_9BASI|nr:hypothetical protein BCV69DRAFT_284659 [Pseudomicrostroma glucosiphilum]PWN19059.1 hypothetical protein BCV69DRAFT_284659 [Pseudomicrostroma glucosiphilum]
MNAIQTHFWAVRDYLAPVLRESKFKEHGRITPEEFVAAGDFLSYKFPTWSWSAGEPSKTREFLPKDKQYLISRGVPCLRRVSQIESAALGGKKGKGRAGGGVAGDEKMLSFAEGQDGVEGTGGEEDWLATHLDDQQQLEEVGEIADIPDNDPPAGAASLTPGEEDALASQVAGTSLSTAAGEDGDGDDAEVGDIPDMDDEDDDEDGLGGMGAGVVEHDDPATLAPPPSTAAANASTESASSSNNLLSVRTYDCLITYDKYYQTPRMWLIGYDESGSPLKPSEIFEDISSDYAQKTVTIEPFPHKSGLSTASVHPCKHASVMKKVIERMDQGVIEEQKRLRAGGGSSGGTPDEGVAGGAAVADKKKKKKWGLVGGAMKKVAGKSSSTAAAAAGTEGGATAEGGADVLGGEAGGVETDIEGLRVDQYLLVFLKFMASIVPAIEIDATQSF